MALYEYACKECEHRFERIMKRGARAPRCPECNGRTARQISAPAIHFKGSGWYVTDYARQGSKDADGGTPAEGKDAGKKPSKPAADKAGKKGGDKQAGKSKGRKK